MCICVFSRYIGGTRAIRRDFMRCAHLARKRTFSTSWAVFTVFFENIIRCANICAYVGKSKTRYVCCVPFYKKQYNTLGWKFQYGYIQASDFWQIAKFWLVEFVTMTSAFGSYYTHRPALVRVLLMFLRNCCAKTATKKRKHNTNLTGMSVNLVVCVLAVLSLSGAQKGRGSAYEAHQCSSWRWNLISSLSMQTVKKLL